MSGSIVLSPTLTLHNVLYIPTFHVNLLSIAKLVNSNDCHVNFTANSCTILQNHSKAAIGTTNLQRGLYVLDATPQSQALHSNATSFCNLWHIRLGHISNDGLKYISKAFPFIPYVHNNTPCDSCHFDKQKKLSFPNSTTVTSFPFEILHADL